MKVLITDNAHLCKTSDGKYYTPTIYSYEFFKRYLNVFDEVRFVGKTKYVNNIDKLKYLLVSGKGLEIYELPWYQGLKEMIKNIFKLIPRYHKVCDGCDCYIFRVAQIESYLTYFLGRTSGKPFAVEVVNDPESFPEIKGIFRWINIKILKHMTSKANGVSYVTEHFLQQMYPSKAKVKGESKQYFESYYSSIDLMPSDIRVPKTYLNTKERFEVIHVSNAIEGNTKGHRTLIEAIKIVADLGYNIQAILIGDGSSVTEFKEYSSNLGVADKVHFVGRFHRREDVLDRLSQSDLFVLPTYMEGLPRSIIEAQAVGLPCISTPVAGIPELLAGKYLFNPEDYKGFANEIMRLIENPAELEEMSRNNIQVAQKYTKGKLTQRRNIFYSKLRQLAEENK